MKSIPLNKLDNKFKFLFIILFFAIYFLFLANSINLVNADLGRHLKNGEYFLENYSVIKTNFYSYTSPDFSVINHHWMSGVLFYLIWFIFGFKGVHLFFIFLSLLSLFIFYKIAEENSGKNIALIAGILTLPLISQRVEIRPEVFSYLFSGLFLLLFLKFREGKINFNKFILSILIIQIFWVNLHIYFFLGPAIACAFLVENIFRKKRDKSKKILFSMFSLFAISILNPFGLKGVFTPFTIFKDYGYRLVENQSVWFLAKILPHINLWVFCFIFVLLVLSFILVFLKDRNNFDWALFFLSVGFSGMAWFMLRNFTIFGLFTLVVISKNFYIIFKKYNISLNNKKTEVIMFFILLVLFLITLSGALSFIYPYNSKINIGVAEDSNSAANFFKQNHLQGPVFNNYDIGGYLIYHLYPNESVFVDNRPEAYPYGFFQEIYIPMQENDDFWKIQSEKYNFNSIIFSHKDFTPWGQEFLIKRIQDKDWAVVYFDSKVIIFLKRNNQNLEIINKFEIYRDYFSV